MKHIRREQTARANLLAKLASTKNKNHYHLVIQMTVPVPNIAVGEEVMAIEENKECWTIPIINFLNDGTCEEVKEASQAKEASEAKVCEVYTDRGRVIQKKLFKTVVEMHQQKSSQVRDGRAT